MMCQCKEKTVDIYGCCYDGLLVDVYCMKCGGRKGCTSKEIADKEMEKQKKENGK